VAVVAVFLTCVAASLAGEANVARYVRFLAGGRAAYGVVEGSRVREIQGDLFGSWRPGEKTYALSEVKILVPCRPSKILAVARNYKSHGGALTPIEHPELFFKPPSCLVADGASIVIPPGAEPVHYEGELVIVVGKRARNVPPEKALDYVLGVTCGNDVSARDWQQKDVQWWRAKGSDTFGPCGPAIVTGLHYDDLLVQTRVNGELKQKERTSQMVHGVAAILSWASRYLTLEPGDLIYTGTPGTTSELKPGDVVEVEIEGIGVLKNPVKAGR
jgi:2-keto-4-pentenoate hydratase/2-oxohepta-3-ene-1,7-dioic acid hydratase in catechol pathway